MPCSRHVLTPEIQTRITAYIRAGGFPHVAAEAAGVPHEFFERWLRLGRQRKACPRYRAFREEVLQAQAQARLTAETAALGEKPMDWLRSGPGRETAARVGWAATPKPRDGDREERNPLLHPLVLALLHMVLRTLEPYPESRIATAETLMNCDLPMSPDEQEEWRDLW